MVTDSLYSFLHQLIDYAGLFPPASLNLEQALRNYRKHLQGEHAWMLERFICPARSLKKALSLWDSWKVTAPLPLSVLCGAVGEANFGHQLEMVEQATQNDRGSVDMLELRLPLSSASLDTVAGTLGNLVQAISDRKLDGLEVFVEAPGADAKTVVDKLAQAGRDSQLGFKLRCGGVQASAFPSLKQVSNAMLACIQRRVPFKATAGLHHPIRYFDSKIGTMSHGFLNIFGGGLLAAVSNRHSNLLEKCLREEDATRFSFKEDNLHYDSAVIPTPHIKAVRSDLLSSFGSCSFCQPIDDLRSLG